MKKCLFIAILMGFCHHANAYHWTVNPNQYANNMTAIAVILIDGMEQNSNSLEVGAFCGNECRGREMPMYVSQLNRYILFMTMYGSDGDQFTFRLYDHELGQEFNGVSHNMVPFGTNVTIGSPGSPYIFEFESTPVNYTIIASANPSNGGSVRGVGTYQSGSTCTLTAIANTGYTFINWTENDEVVSEESRYTFMVSGQRALVAHFELASVTWYRFITSGTWGNAANWSGGVLPGVNDAVFIDANCTLNRDAEVAMLAITPGKTLTLRSGRTLTVTSTLTNTATTGLVIKEGSQLINASVNVAATMEKEIFAHDDASTGWYTIASPMSSMPIAGSGFVTPEYDLYRYNETNLTSEEWENYKANHQGFTTFEKGRGYLYANSDDFTSTFTGVLNASDVTYSLTCTNQSNDPLTGFNLIGNPFPHEIYKGLGGAIDNVNLASGYYTLTNEGTWQVHSFDDAILPGQGILVKAIASTELTISKSKEEAFAESGEAKKEIGRLCFSVSGDGGRDRAFVYFGEGIGLDKRNDLVAKAPALCVRDNGKDYAIAHVEDTAESLVLCFGNKREGDFTLAIKISSVKFEYLQLVDHVTGLTVDLLQQPIYSFHATGQEPDARFSIRFKVAE